MKIDLMNVLYTTSMLILAFFGALILTKMVAKYLPKDEQKEDAEKEDAKKVDVEKE